MIATFISRPKWRPPLDHGTNRDTARRVSSRLLMSLSATTRGQPPFNIGAKCRVTIPECLSSSPSGTRSGLHFTFTVRKVASNKLRVHPNESRPLRRDPIRLLIPESSEAEANRLGIKLLMARKAPLGSIFRKLIRSRIAYESGVSRGIRGIDSQHQAVSIFSRQYDVIL